MTKGNKVSVDLIELIEIAYKQRRLDRFTRLVRQWIKDNKPNAYQNVEAENREQFKQTLTATIEAERKAAGF